MLALITATKNSGATLTDALDSLALVRPRIKSIFVDGHSTDDTYEVLEDYCRKFGNSVLSKQDGFGLYQALNQGIALAVDDSEVSYIGFLHSDDSLIPAAFSRYIEFIDQIGGDFYFSGVEFRNSGGRIYRRWNPVPYSGFRLRSGWMPPHTTVVVSKSVYKRFGGFDPAYGSAADYEWLVRVLKPGEIDAHCFNERILIMNGGGASSQSLRARLRANTMDGRAWHGSSLLFQMFIRLAKPTRKMGQYFRIG